MKILTTEAFLRGAIPRRDDFQPALEQFESDCVIPFLGNEVLGSFAYGSVNRNDCNIASDIDYFMIISKEDHKKIVREATKRAYEERKICIQTRVIHQEHARAGFHGLDSSFRQHLSLSVARYGHRGKNPLEILAENTVPFKESLRRSISVYLMKLNNGFTTFPTSEEAHVDFLKDIMEKPFHAMRVAIQYTLGTVAPEGDGVFNDTKDELCRVYSGLGFNSALINDVHTLRATARDYVYLLEERQRENLPQNEMKKIYAEMLDRIMACYPESFHFIEQNARCMMKR